MKQHSAQHHLLNWFRANKRDLPWRANRDPYRIWISETMLQQTTTTAVIPFFERFLELFPTLPALAMAQEGTVIAAWAGLGYYSRARNLHKAAQQLHALGRFPQTYQQLLDLPGFGPYTARAVASLAFGQNVGVVDGNVIRVLSRFTSTPWQWWKPAARNKIQTLADRWVADLPSSDINQGFMELGRTICTPRSPSCPMCPLSTNCLGLRQGSPEELPLTKPKQPKQIWWWQPEVHMRKGRLGLILNDKLPFLKGQWLLPGQGRAAAQPPKKFDYRHSITHYDIFVTVARKIPKLKGSASLAPTRWVPLEEIQQHVPTSLVLKALRMAAGSAPPRRVR